LPKKKPMPENATLIRQLLCEECRRPWLVPQERWRVYLTDDEPAEAVPYCPGCAAREFDPD
jgi:RNase P subunit RPR2